MAKKVNIDDCKISDETFRESGKVWVVANLIELSKDLEVFDLPLMHIDIDVKPWSPANIKEFAYHMKRASKTDLQYPVIMNDGGFIMNGWHRITKALVEGRDSVKAVRF